MKKQTKIIKHSGTIIKSIVKKSLERDINNSTCITLYQPQVPMGIKEFYKNNKNDK